MTNDEFLNFQPFPGCVVTYKEEVWRVVETEKEEGLFCISLFGVEKWVRYENAKLSDPLLLNVLPHKKSRSKRKSIKGKPWTGIHKN